MPIPDYSLITKAVYASGSFNLSTHDGCGQFIEACARELYARDQNFGHLRKRPGQNNYNGHAVDCVLYRAEGKTVDLISNSESSKAKLSWRINKDDKYTDTDWYAPNGTHEPPVIIDPTTELKEKIAVLEREKSALLTRIAYLESNPSYVKFVTSESWEVRAAYIAATGNEPAVSDMYHNAYRRLVEKWPHQAVLKGIIG